MTTVFDVADELLRRAPNNKLQTIKLQKLVFYVFGWYGHVVGRPLFEQGFYSMKYGPVVTNLLDVHAQQRSLSLDDLRTQVATSKIEDSHVAAVVDAVWATYGKYDAWDLVEMTHQEDPWSTSWASAELRNAKRGDMSSDELVAFFEEKRTSSYMLRGKLVSVPVLSMLPDAFGRAVTTAEFAEMENCDQVVPANLFTDLPSDYQRLLMSI
ncbi:Panacea domain-containing protein [Arthrobacter sp. STN4]|uniref:Panacea domain-containing protein n=1 Tax=Arthrobacter sp. STN4 TaxID=2923276 RepID=UPI00211A5D31|nr:type II toxin-antitoxin system antitoxin SocA domain-containing protein [Arthrobacter sp. STN4]MCQ9164121.1 DUF4065 domain-containing protein [Arthrobacter sp. STN4]